MSFRDLAKYLGVWILTGMLAGCTAGEVSEKKFRVGFSQCTSFDSWRQTMEDEMRRELSFHEDIDFVIRTAEGNNDLQIQHIRQFIEERVDVLVISPNEADPVTQVVDEAYQRGIPVVLLDRKTNSSFYTAYIGADNYEIGQIAARYLVNLLDGKGEVLEIKGLKGSTPFIERHQGFRSVIDQQPGIRVTAIDGDWGDKKDAELAFRQLLEDGARFDFIFAHNDIMAFAAYNVYRSMGRTEPVRIVGVDGLPGANGGIAYVADGTLFATVLYPTGGDKAIQVAADILHNRPYAKENKLVTTIIDSSNVHVMQMQTNKLLSHQQDISRLGTFIEQQRVVYRNQQYYLYTVAFLFIVSTLSFAFALKLLRERREINKSLERRNEEILKQKAEVVEMSERAAEANQARIKFFANISHELKTPLTLILGPLEEMENDRELSSMLQKDVRLAKKNVLRLLRLVNQLMDFQKIENGKMKLQASQTDLVAFLREIMEAFKPLAESGKYHFHLMSDQPEVQVWCDRNMLDKVFFNLLINAFKFTPPRGKIAVMVSLLPAENLVEVKITDSGMGFQPDQLPRVFERFFQGDETRHDGTGLGLSLSKEIIELHHGEICVEQASGGGAVFVVKLKLGKDHLQSDQLLLEGRQVEHEQLEMDFLYEEEESLPQASEKRDHTILIIEDNAELREFLRSRLGGYYEILEASNGEAGLALAREHIPDVVLCDLALPKLNGRQVLLSLKSDLRTSHIPFVMMTSSSSLDEKLAGISAGADEFITKPFSFRLLSERIRTILINTDKLRNRFLHELPAETDVKVDENLDKKFVNDFTRTVEENLSDQNLDVNVICEKMGFSRIQLYRKVKAMLGYSVNDYISSVRLKKAKYLLKTTQKSIAEICYEVGYSSPSYFSATFKSKFDQSPSEYRQSGRK